VREGVQRRSSGRQADLQVLSRYGRRSRRFLQDGRRGKLAHHHDQDAIRRIAFTITFDQWDACVAAGGCENNARPSDQTWGRGSRPVIDVDWRDAQNYVTWLNRMTGTDSYRLLSEAEWEYSARGVTSAQAPHLGQRDWSK
jgi:hypothetical protein